MDYSGASSSLETNEWTPMSSEEINRKYREISQESGRLTIGGKQHKVNAKDLKYDMELGVGAFGVVQRAKYAGIQMAVKIIPITDPSTDFKKKTLMDMDVIKKSNDCPQIVHCYGFFTFDQEVRICMELMKMSLDKLLRMVPQGFPEIIVGKIAHQLVLALKYLKEKHRVAHRDIKPSNILINDNGEIKVCDFGICGRLIDSNRVESHTRGNICYLAPERIEWNEYGVSADVWSLGITLFEIATGRNPYFPGNEFSILIRIRDDSPPRITPSNGFSQNFCSFIERCLQKDRNKRAKYSELLDHEFLKSTVSDNSVEISTWFQEIMNR